MAMILLYKRKIRKKIMAQLNVKPKSKSSWWIWLLLLIIAIIVAAFVYNTYRGTTVVTTTDSTRTTTDSAKTTTDTASRKP